MNYTRALILIPEGLTFESLSPEQQAAIGRVFGQYVMPMTGTIPFDGTVICDAVTSDAFDPAAMSDLGLNWPVIGLFTDAGYPIIPLDEQAYLDHLPVPEIIDPETGETVGQGEKVLHETSRWAGWPKCFGE